MTYENAINYIHSIPKFRRPLGNANLERLLEHLKNPYKELKFIHIAGTNGKGSMAAMTARILQEAGYKTGLFTSPYIEVFNERIQINCEMISDNDLAEYTEKVKRSMEENDAPVSEFAFITAVSFLYFADKECDFVVLEAGMGGRLDATNVIRESVVSVITSISLDHTQYLGDTIEEIALEKCGIIKEGGTVVSSEQNGAEEIIQKAARKMNASVIFARGAKMRNGAVLYKGRTYPLALKGEYQAQNAATALEAVFAMRKMGIKIDDEAIEKGLKNVQWQSRFEFLTDRLIIDGAHNQDAMRVLRQSLEKLEKPVTIVIAMMQDKSVRECVKEIAPAARRIIVSEIDMPRCMRARELCGIINDLGYECEAVPDAAKAAERALEYEGMVCVCGSLYFTGEIRRLYGTGDFSAL